MFVRAIYFIFYRQRVLLTNQSIYKKKDEDLATKERLIGNDYFKKGKLNEAFNHYSLSIIKATYTSGTQNEKVM